MCERADGPYRGPVLSPVGWVSPDVVCVPVGGSWRKLVKAWWTLEWRGLLMGAVDGGSINWVDRVRQLMCDQDVLRGLGLEGGLGNFSQWGGWPRCL